jgi:hypothetical protein
MCEPCRERIVLRAAKALARSPAARCIDPDAEMPWLPFTADAQRIRTKAMDEPLRDVEARALQAYMRELGIAVQLPADEARSIVENWTGTQADLKRRVRERMNAMRADLAKEVQAISQPYAQTMADAGARAALEALPQRLPVVQEMVAFGDANPLAVRAAQNSATRLATSVSEDVASRISAIVADGVDAGLTTDEIAEQIAAAGGMSPERAQMIARTESAYAYTEGRIEAWQDTGVVQGKRWLLSPDACEFCEAAAREYGQKTIPLDQPFYVIPHTLTGTRGGTMRLTYRNVDGPPLHPNCRCDTIATIDPQVLE